MPYALKVKGLDEMREAFRKSPKLATEIFGEAVRNAGAKIQEIEKEEVPIDTGNLRRRVEMKFHLPMSAIVTPNVDYAIFVHEGTKPHLIPVGKKGFLAFKINGKWVYTKRAVQHTGSKPNKFVPRTVNRAELPVNQILSKALKTFTEKLATKS